MILSQAQRIFKAINSIVSLEELLLFVKSCVPSLVKFHCVSFLLYVVFVFILCILSKFS